MIRSKLEHLLPTMIRLGCLNLAITADTQIQPRLRNKAIIIISLGLDLESLALVGSHGADRALLRPAVERAGVVDASNEESVLLFGVGSHVPDFVEILLKGAHAAIGLKFDGLIVLGTCSGEKLGVVSGRADPVCPFLEARDRLAEDC